MHGFFRRQEASAVAGQSRIVRIRTPLASRWKFCAIALVALAWVWSAIPNRARSSLTWVEVYGRPRATCYQGPPRRVVMQVQLWSGGPGLRVMQERQFQTIVGDKRVASEQ